MRNNIVIIVLSILMIIIIDRNNQKLAKETAIYSEVLDSTNKFYFTQLQSKRSQVIENMKRKRNYELKYRKVINEFENLTIDRGIYDKTRIKSLNQLFETNYPCNSVLDFFDKHMDSINNLIGANAELNNPKIIVEDIVRMGNKCKIKAFPLFIQSAKYLTSNYNDLYLSVSKVH